jgi:hypothetical protein
MTNSDMIYSSMGTGSFYMIVSEIVLRDMGFLTHWQA